MERIELEKENELLRVALTYVMALAERKNPHLGHPRLSDEKCIFCMSYFALNNGAYGYSVSKEYYENLINGLT